MAENKQLFKLFAGEYEIFFVCLLMISSVLIFFHLDNNELNTEMPDKWKVTSLSIPAVTELKMPITKLYQLPGKLGNMTIEWNSRGFIRVLSSPCPCKMCINIGWRRTTSIICVPNEIIIEPILPAINEVDAITR